ncbi:MAG: response regulator transcription factor [Anaerovoracaceae bacterium]|jgi:DNA-binding response OmpR family regulator
MSKDKILVIDDEKAINKLVSSYLVNNQFEPLSAYDGKSGLELIREESPDLIILDIMLPDIEGTSLCLEIRKISEAPIIFLSCKTQEIDKIIALSAGGDDYMTKPFMPGELIARIKAHLRRRNNLTSNPAALQEHVYVFDDLRIDFDTYELFIGDQEVSLTTIEFEILKTLIENPRKVFSAKQIFEKVWKAQCMDSDTKTVMVYISNLRKKIEPNPEIPKFIITVRGVGYKFNQSLSK